MRALLLFTTATCCALLALSSKAQAIPAFAHRYDFTCQQCHTMIPHLNAFGLRFLRNGFRLPGPATRDEPGVHVAVESNLAYTSEPDPTGLPKAIVDEVEILSGGSYGHLSYFSDYNVLDGGRPGQARDLWLGYWGTPSASGSSLRAKIGNLTLPLPVDPEIFRETENHYAVFDQTVGTNPFNFFDDRFGADIGYGNPNRGVDAHVLLLRQNNMMGYAQWQTPKATFSAYRYQGTSQPGGPADRFVRNGFGVSLPWNRLTTDFVIQNGTDTNADGTGSFARGSGGFLQTRWEFSRGLSATVRYDGTQDSLGGFLRSTTFALNRRISRNGRLTLEDVLTHDPFAKHTLNIGYMFAY